MLLEENRSVTVNLNWLPVVAEQAKKLRSGYPSREIVELCNNVILLAEALETAYRQPPPRIYAELEKEREARILASKIAHSRGMKLQALLGAGHDLDGNLVKRSGDGIVLGRNDG